MSYERTSAILRDTVARCAAGQPAITEIPHVGLHSGARDRALSASVTLDGRPAKIIGRRNDFATVASLDGQLSAEWSWETAVRIADGDGRFSL